MEDRVRSRLATFGLRRLVATLAFCAKHFVLVAIATDAEVATSVVELGKSQSGDKLPHSQKSAKKRTQIAVGQRSQSTKRAETPSACKATMQDSAPGELTYWIDTDGNETFDASERIQVSLINLGVC